MTEAVQILSRGLGIGSVYALIALGFVIIYKATRVISFAQPAFMLAGAVLVDVPRRAARLLRRAAAGRARHGRARARRGAGGDPADGRPARVHRRHHHPRHRRRGAGRRLGRIGIELRPVGDPWGLDTTVLFGASVQQRAHRHGGDHRRPGDGAVPVLPLHPDGAGDARGRLRPGGRAGPGRLGGRGLRHLVGHRRRAGGHRRHVRRGRQQRRLDAVDRSRWSPCR